MFKPNEKIVCVNAGILGEEYRPNIKNGNIYTVKECDVNGYSIFVTIDGEFQIEKFFATRFISLQDYRKLKLKKLNESRR